MSRAFVKEQDGEAAIDDLPERPLSQHPNFVTAEGLAQIELELARQQEAWSAAKAAGDEVAVVRIGRDLRYWIARRATAQVMALPRDGSRVQFGAIVAVQRDDGRRQSWRIVGEDEADPAHGTLSYVSPLAQALVGREAGETVQVGEREFQIVSID